ncbi:Arylsulfatase [Caprobacter fermentans]|uniref:Arylsulfatase n=1 Tax=Caproicibacter fermentans TaxID=2576756 RepID=A0A6N8HZ11_9FIRM|nr:sulfatase-like hydrolase/transferase [Caproicibacter fermentans]MVB10717.1 Arylsulfatase [Caproicibacter fermentans]OCN00480.1 sulfatase [Clostridium sp. W14A]
MKKRQVVLIMTDTTRKDMLGCYGNQKMKTPNLDRMAKQGIKYENAYTCQPVCGPARSAIFTGTFPHSNGVVTNCVPFGANVKTIGHRLTDHGIHCGYVGKWHLDGGDYFGLGSCPEGWDPDYWYDMKCYLNELSDQDKSRSRRMETAFDPDWTEGMTYAGRCTSRALDFLERYWDENFFLTVSFDEPHGPCICPAPWNTMYDGFQFDDNPNFQDDLSKKPFFQQLWAGDAIHQPKEEINHPSRALSLFLGCNSFVDYEIGKLLDKIEDLIPDALVIFTSDHGDMLGAHRLQMKNAAPYKEIANIPLIIKGGERGKTIRFPASHIDLVPTIMDYMGLPLPHLLEGKSMLPQIKNSGKKINDNVFTEFTRYEVDHDGFGGLQMTRAIVNEKYKLVINLLDSDEFYDLEQDPWEVENRINDPAYQAIRSKMHDLLLDHMNQTRDLFRGYQWACRSWRPEKKAAWANSGFTRQRENEEYEPRQLDYDTGLPMEKATRMKTTKDEKN